MNGEKTETSEESGFWKVEVTLTSGTCIELTFNIPLLVCPVIGNQHKGSGLVTLRHGTADPLLVLPGASGCGREAAEYYVPTPDSPVLHEGTPPARPAETDFFGNSTAGRRYIGAFIDGARK